MVLRGSHYPADVLWPVNTQLMSRCQTVKQRKKDSRPGLLRLAWPVAAEAVLVDGVHPQAGGGSR